MSRFNLSSHLFLASHVKCVKTGSSEIILNVSEFNMICNFSSWLCLKCCCWLKCDGKKKRKKIKIGIIQPPQYVTYGFIQYEYIQIYRKRSMREMRAKHFYSWYIYGLFVIRFVCLLLGDKHFYLVHVLYDYKYGI